MISFLLVPSHQYSNMSTYKTYKIFRNENIFSDSASYPSISILFPPNFCSQLSWKNHLHYFFLLILETTNIWQLPHTPSSPLPTGTTSCQDNQQLLVFKSNGPFYINYWTSLLTIWISDPFLLKPLSLLGFPETMFPPGFPSTSLITPSLFISQIYPFPCNNKG